MRDRSLLVFLLLLIATGLVNGQVKTVTYVSDPSSTPPDLVIALHHVGGSLAFVPEVNLVKGKVTLTFTPNRYQTDSMVFHAPGFTMHSLELNGKPCRYAQNGGNLVV